MKKPIDRVIAAHYAVYAEGLDDDPAAPATAKELRQAATLLTRHGMIAAAVELFNLAADRD